MSTDGRMTSYWDTIAQRTDLMPEMDDSEFAEGIRQQKLQADQQALAQMGAQNAQSGNNLGQVGGITTSGGLATASPYVAGAGLTLQAIGMVDSAKRKNEQAKIDAYNNKIMAQRSAVRNMFS